MTNLDTDTIDEIAGYVADTFWVNAYADVIERAADDGIESARDLMPGAGGDWLDVAPNPPTDIAARFLSVARKVLNGLPQGVLAAGFEAWTRQAGDDWAHFGHCLAMRILGTGVGLWDDVRPSQCPQGSPDHNAIKALDRALPTMDCSSELFLDYEDITR